MSSQSEPPDPRFTVLVRLPFPRGDFVDPPAVRFHSHRPPPPVSHSCSMLTSIQPNWTAAKDRVLWEALLQPSKAIDCEFH